MTEEMMMGMIYFFAGWLLRGLFSRLFISGKLLMLTKNAERKCLTMLGRAHEHYHHSLAMLKTAGEATDRNNEIIRTINSLEFTHKQWQKNAVQSIYEEHPFQSSVKWYDWRTAMQTLENEKHRRNNK
jgi:uncharacterized protein Yka (UPF0111/DUF47 family)